MLNLWQAAHNSLCPAWMLHACGTSMTAPCHAFFHKSLSTVFPFCHELHINSPPVFCVSVTSYVLLVPPFYLSRDRHFPSDMFVIHSTSSVIVLEVAGFFLFIYLFIFFFLLNSILQSHFVAVNGGVFWWWDYWQWLPYGECSFCFVGKELE